jgi:multidrug efflux pump subunit AcrB
MVREIFPRFDLDIITVSVPLPGADPNEVEESICLKLEEALWGVDGVDELKTAARDNVGTATIRLKESADLQIVLNDIKTRVDAITTFPKDAERPIVKDIKFRSDVCSIVVWGELPERQLRELARSLEQKLLQSTKVSQISISGIRDAEIMFEFREETLRKLNLSFSEVAKKLEANGVDIPSGTLRSPKEEFRIRAIGRKYHAKEYRQFPILTREDGSVIRLGDIATIRDTFDEDATQFTDFNGKPAVSLNIFKTEDEDSIKISNYINTFIT